MVAYSFRKRFVDKIEDGSKRQTIRPWGLKRHARVGEEVQLYFGQRTKHCRLLRRAECWAADNIWINFDLMKVMISGKMDVAPPTLFEKRDDLDAFARDDGFSSWADLVEFWSVEHYDGAAPDGVFYGVIVKWL